MRFPNLRRFFLGLGVLSLAACGGGSGGSDAPDVLQVGQLSIGMTDAPVDSVEEVRIYVTGVTVKKEDGPPESFPLNLTDCTMEPGESDSCNPLNLLGLRDGVVQSLLDERDVIAGRYQWLRAEIDEARSYVVEDGGGIVPLRIPSARGLQLSSGFVVLQDRTTHLLLDWDIRKGLVDPVGQAGLMLKPTIRVVDMAAFGAIAGTVDDALTSGDCSSEPDTGRGNLVYVFEGDVVPDDIDNNAPNPLVTAPVRSTSNGAFTYRVDYLPPGSYTVAFTCHGLDDDVPESDTDLTEADDDIEFVSPQLVEIADGATTSVDFEI
ncbi:MAG: DUF4382 domain-containing protein [Pseudomonadales bacterium]